VVSFAEGRNEET